MRWVEDMYIIYRVVIQIFFGFQLVLKEAVMQHPCLLKHLSDNSMNQQEKKKKMVKPLWGCAFFPSQTLVLYLSKEAPVVQGSHRQPFCVCMLACSLPVPSMYRCLGLWTLVCLYMSTPRWRGNSSRVYLAVHPLTARIISSMNRDP